MKFKNVSPFGGLEVPSADGFSVTTVAAGDSYEATGDEAQSLLAQSDVWTRVDEPVTRKSADVAAPAAVDTKTEN